MGKRQQRQSFADIVREVRQQPRIPEDDNRHYGLDLGRAKDPSGRVWHRVADEISPARALQIVRDGGLVAHDPCGCGGYCGITWFTTEQCALLADAGAPRVALTKRKWGHLSEWATDDGQRLVVAENWVEWGDLLG